MAYLGSASGLQTSPAWSAVGGNTRWRFGISTAPAGDVDGDGFDDAIIAAKDYSDGSSAEGAGFLYRGADRIP